MGGKRLHVLVQKGRFSAGTFILHMRLKKEDLPTLGRPTMPILTWLPGRPSSGFSSSTTFLGGMAVARRVLGGTEKKKSTGSGAALVRLGPPTKKENPTPFPCLFVGGLWAAWPCFGIKPGDSWQTMALQVHATVNMPLWLGGEHLLHRHPVAHPFPLAGAVPARVVQAAHRHRHRRRPPHRHGRPQRNYPALRAGALPL